MYKVWRQAYRIDGTLRPAATISRSNISYSGALEEFTRNKNKQHIQERNSKVYWLGLQLFDNELEANREIYEQ